MRALRGVALTLLLGAAACRHVPAAEDPMSTTTVYLAKRIRTMDATHPIAEAVAIRDGKILAVGQREEVMAAAGDDPRVVDVGTAIIVPGLQDAHGHLAHLGRSLTVTSLEGARSVEEVVARLRAAEPESFQGDWLIARGWDQNDWPAAHGAFPDRAVLDAAFPTTPVFLTRVDGHAAWVNGAALVRAGLSARTPDPEGGRLLRRPDGTLTGVLIDNAIPLVESKLPPLTDEQLQKRLVMALRKLASEGITTFHDAGIDLRTFEQLQRWDALGALPIRVYAMAEAQGGEGAQYLGRGTYSGRMLEMRAAKLYADGALGSRGAALHAPYADDPGNTGLLLLRPEELQQKVDVFMARGFQVCIHAIGDRANTLALDVLERAMAEVPDNAGRHRIEHAQVLRREDVPRLAKLGVVASMQPSHATSDMAWAEARLGPERIRGAYAWRSILDSGAALAFGSDFPIEEPDPLAGIYAARTRQDAEGRPAGGWHPEQRITGEEALYAFTVGAAYASFAEDRRGALRPGMDADFTVLSVDPVEDDPKALLSGKVLKTVVAGVEIYSAPAAAKTGRSP